MSMDVFEKHLGTLAVHPPSFSSCLPREEAFLGIGKFLEAHIRAGQQYDLEKNPNSLWNVIQNRLLAVLDEVQDTSVGAGEVHLWQMYNSGIIIKTSDMTLGFDVIPLLRAYGWAEPEGVTARIANLLDMLLITHRHPDHFDSKQVQACLAAGKSVCVPEPMASALGPCEQLHEVADGWTHSSEGAEIRGRQAYHVWRENMDDVPSVYYEVACRNGFTFLFSGDADYTKTFEKTSGQKIDLLFLPWRNPNALYEDGQPGQIGTTEDAVRIALDRVQPARILLEHYAELEHVRDGFPASYDMALMLKQALPVPCEWMFWGESIHLSSIISEQEQSR